MCSIIVRQVYLHYKGHFRLQWRRTPENLGVANATKNKIYDIV
jgi:hypothetical protein